MTALTAINAKAAAQVLGLSARKLYDLAKTGQLASYKFGGAVRFDLADIEIYKTSCRLPVITPVNGSISLTASLPGQDSELTEFFRQDGRKSKRTNLIGSKPRDSSRLQLVSQKLSI